MCSTPSASSTAWTTAGIAPIVPSSPQPLTPSRLVLQGTLSSKLASGELAERASPIGAGDAKAPIAIFDVRLRGLQHLGSERSSVVDHAPARGDDGRAADERRARADAADAIGTVGVALHDMHL